MEADELFPVRGLDAWVSKTIRFPVLGGELPIRLGRSGVAVRANYLGLRCCGLVIA